MHNSKGGAVWKSKCAKNVQESLNTSLADIFCTNYRMLVFVLVLTACSLQIWAACPSAKIENNLLQGGVRQSRILTTVNRGWQTFATIITSFLFCAAFTYLFHSTWYMELPSHHFVTKCWISTFWGLALAEEKKHCDRVGDVNRTRAAIFCNKQEGRNTCITQANELTGARALERYFAASHAPKHGTREHMYDRLLAITAGHGLGISPCTIFTVSVSHWNVVNYCCWYM